MFTQRTVLMKAALYYGIAFGLILLLALFELGLGRWILAIAMLTPLTAVLLMLLVVTRDGYTRTGWQTLGLHRLGWRTWGMAILAPLLVMLCTYSIAWATGIGRLDWVALKSVIALDGPVNLLSTIGRVLQGLLLSTPLALAEEIGWRGYLLPHLLPLGRTRALLGSGLLHGIWHLPILLLTPFYHEGGDRLVVATLFVLSVTVGSVFFGYLRLTSGSVWSAALGHGAFNLFWGTFMGITVAVGPSSVLEYWAGESGVITLIEVALLAGWLLYRLDRQATPAPGRAVLVSEPLKP